MKSTLTVLHGTKWIALWSAAIIGLTASGQETSKSKDAVRKTAESGVCHAIGDTVTIVGRSTSNATSFTPLEGFCVHYPGPNNLPMFNLPIAPPFTVGVSENKLPGDLYIEVTGEILDGYPYGVPQVAIKVLSVRDVDDEVYAFFDNAKRNCEQWQKDNSARLTAQTHGGSVVPVWNFAHMSWDRTGIPHHDRQCGLWAVDTVLPHKRIDMWRVESSLPFSPPSTTQSAETVPEPVGSPSPDIRGAVDFSPGCKLPSATYKPPYAPFNEDGPIGHSYALLDLIVTKGGLPVDIHVASGSSSKSQAIYAILHMEEWKFRPAECNGEIVAMKVSIKQEFNLSPHGCPSTGCTVPDAPTNPAITGLRLPVPRMVIDGVPALPDGCVAPRLLEKNEPVIHVRDFASVAKDSGFAEIIAGGYAEADIVVDDHGRSGIGEDTGVANGPITLTAPRRSLTLENLLSNNLQSWRWTPAACAGSDVRAVIPEPIDFKVNALYTVYAMAHIRYDFHPAAVKGSYTVISKVTLGDSLECKELRLTTIAQRQRAPYLACAKR